MTINETQSTTSSLLNTVTKANSSSSSSFLSLLGTELAAKVTSANTSSSSETSTSSETSEAVKAFMEELSSKGALQFYQDYNQEKIEQLMEEKKAELTDTLGLNSDSTTPLTGEDREKALATLDDMLDAYRKQLQEKMQAEDKLDQQNTMLSTFLQDLA